MVILNGLLWAFLRRWFGGFNPFGKETAAGKIFGLRSLQSVVMIGSFFAVLYYRELWYIVLINAVWVQFQFWSRAIGCILDCGRNTIQTKKNYNRWYGGALDWIYDRLGLVKYTGYYDWWYGWLRYTLPMIVPAVTLHSWNFIFIGLASSPVYFGCWRLFEAFPDLCKKLPEWCGEPKNLAELIYGFIFGALLAAV